MMIAPFVQKCGNVSIINSGGYGYCVPGLILRAINGTNVPINKHFERQLMENSRHDLSTYFISKL